MTRYLRLAPPPRWRDVMRPCVFRPPDFFRPVVSAFSGSDFVTSARSLHVAKRRPGEVGLWRLTAIRRHRMIRKPSRPRTQDRRLAPASRVSEDAGMRRFAGSFAYLLAFE